MSAAVVEPWAREDQARFRRMLHLAGASPQLAVCTAGRSNVELMVRLCRAGYARVECLRQATCTCADGGVDILMIPGGTATESLVTVVLRTARVLREGGVVALKLEDIDDDCAVQAALAGLDLDVVSTVFDMAEDVLVAHTVRRRQVRALAS